MTSPGWEKVLYSGEWSVVNEMNTCERSLKEVLVLGMEPTSETPLQLRFYDSVAGVLSRCPLQEAHNKRGHFAGHTTNIIPNWLKTKDSISVWSAARLD